MASTCFPVARFKRVHIALAAVGCCTMPLSAWAQADNDTAITITGRGLGSAGVTGFGSAAPARTPLQTSTVGVEQLADTGIATLAGLVALDASIADAYTAEGYWSNLAVRGYTLSNRFNYRRDGLPINAETALALDNKERIEVLKGTSGIQAGTSSPGGLVNLVVKRPSGNSVRSAFVELRQPGSVRAAVDLSERFGPDGRFGLRVNAAAARLDPPQRDTEGRRSMLAVAGDWQVTPDTLLQAEAETSHQSQPSVAGFSMRGNVVPTVGRDAGGIDPRLNLNHQPWSQPVVMDGTTASLRLQQRLGADWTFTAHAMQQRLKSDDRTAFPYGVYDPATYGCNPCDRFAPDGTFTYWQYVSDNERRTAGNLLLQLAGQLQTAGLRHQLETGVLLTRQRGRFQDQIYDIAGTGRDDGSLTTPPSPGGTDANTNYSERSTELFVRDAVTLSERLQLWAGLRHNRLDRAAERTSGDPRATDFQRNATTPWLALSYQLLPRTMVYASWGKGQETDVAPNRARYTNPGQSLALDSRQVEAGIKHGTDRVEAALTLFDISRSASADIDRTNPAASADCASVNRCTRVVDGNARHRGVEAQGAWQIARWTLQASALWLDAERRGSAQPGINGNRPENVAKASVRLGTEYAPQVLPGLALLAQLAADGDRVVLPYDQRVRIPGWGRLDLGARWRQTVGDAQLTWRVGVDNATDRRAWKESPYQFGHVYLYPLAPRTWRASLLAAF